MITKEPTLKNNCTKRLYFTHSARIGFSHLIKYLDFNKSQKILIPSYIGITDNDGSGVFDPIKENRIKFDFYKLDDTLSIDVSDFELKLKSGDFKAALVIHYFGFPQKSIELISKICVKHNTLLIEDCAHSLNSKFNGKLLGDFGDFSFFSIHKIISTNDGGILKINNPSFNIPPLKDDAKAINISTLEQLYATDINKISSIRKNNYRFLVKKLSSVKDIKIMYPFLDKGTVPLNFPIIVYNDKRENLYFKLIEDGIITTSLYYRIISEIDRVEFPVSYSISNSILNLPVHQDTTKEDLRFIVKHLTKHINAI